MQFDPNSTRVPCIVVSPNEFNRESEDAVVVLQCIEYHQGDADEATLLPLGPDGQLAGIEGEWSIALHLVRGIARASSVIRRSTAPVGLPMVDPDRFGDLQTRLEYFYA